MSTKSPPCCRDGHAPRSNQSYWLPKLTRNKGRDAASIAALKAAGWLVLVVWECETRDAAVLRTRLEAFLGPRPQRGNTDASREKAREAGNVSRDGSAKSIISAA